MTFRLSFFLTPTLFVTGMCANSAPPSETLNELMARMDKSAASFTGMTAKMKRVDHTEILGENELETGSVTLKRVPGGLLGRVDFNEPNRRTVSLHDRTVEVYTPKSNTVQITDVGKHGQQLDQFLLLGFGTSGKELAKNYVVKLIGPEVVADKQTTHIQITPRAKEATEYFKKAEIWMAQGSTYPVQEKIHKNEQDYMLFTYSDVRINVPLADKDLELRLPPGVKKIK